MNPIAIQQQQPLATRAPSVLKLTTASFIERLLRHPFLVGCGDGTVTLDEMRSFLVQQGKYSSYFTRFLCALISQLDDGEDVLRLAGNLVEELGYGAEAQVPHSRIYADMLKGFGISLEDYPFYAETQNLVNTMFMLCRQPGGIAGLGALCLGAEAIVPAMYRRIISGFQSCGVETDRLEFFLIHIRCDDDHTETMYEMIARRISQSRSSHISAIEAGEIAINARLRFFDALLRKVQ